MRAARPEWRRSGSQLVSSGVGKLPDAEPPTQVADLQACGKGAVVAVVRPPADAAHAASPPVAAISSSITARLIPWLCLRR